MRVVVALGLALIVVLAGVAAALSAERQRLAGTNNVFDSFPSIPIAPGQEACGRPELVPGGTAAVRVHAESDAAGGVPLAVRIAADGRDVARGTLAPPWDGAYIDVLVRPVIDRTIEDAAVCVTNQGDATATLWGYGAADDRNTEVDGELIDQRIRLTYVRAGEESGWEIAGAVVHRMGIGRGSLLEGWAFYGWLVALAGVLAAVVATTLRELRR